ncbi:laminin B domain-containing protein [Spirosoma pollinicola]|uniref:Laminin IV type A domain-containing protein n=1 Tax=Spirosoma pollinicola TaxID=2057025 RepID=A0A2K8YV70_9BACT|nr:laminin B domain-containing protein [Spirosoma pollinicola]AUD01458.1 hypothetical protein CWM47_06310 [Spirosoma pollinicola]
MCSKREILVLYKLIFIIGLFSLLSVGCSESSINKVFQANVNSFDTDDQGGRVSSGGLGIYRPTGGNPDGYLSAIDAANGVWYFIASQTFINEVKKRYGQTLRFDLEQSVVDNQASKDDVILASGLDTLRFNTAYNPKTTWMRYAVKLDESSGWKKNRKIVSQADIQTVLQNLTNLRIRGEFRAGPDQGGLDNAAIY